MRKEREYEFVNHEFVEIPKFYCKKYGEGYTVKKYCKKQCEECLMIVKQTQEKNKKLTK